ncbi:glycosyltransferase, partial [Streptococcus pyogenes]
MDYKKATIIISFYNNKKALSMIFQSLKEESNYNFDVIVADDGSSDD